MFYLEQIKKSNFKNFQTIEKIFNSKNLSHAYILNFTSDNDIDNFYLAIIEKIINQNQTKYYNPESYGNKIIIENKKIIKKEDIIGAKFFLEKKGFENLKAHFLIIKNIEDCNLSSYNTLLKFLEEPKDNIFILMITKNKNKIIKTITSRSQIINIHKTNQEGIFNLLLENNIEKEDAKILSSYFSNVKKILEFYKTSYQSIKKNMIDFINEISINKNNLSFWFNKFVKNQDEGKYFAILLRIFVNDLINLNEDNLLFQSQKKIIDNFLKIKINKIKLMIHLDDFINKLDYNYNFNLLKKEITINLLRSYE